MLLGNSWVDRGDVFLQCPRGTDGDLDGVLVRGIKSTPICQDAPRKWLQSARGATNSCAMAEHAGNMTRREVL